MNDPLATAKMVSNREAEMLVLHENREFLEANHPGEWVAVEGDRIMAVGPDFGVVQREAKAKGARNAILKGIKSKEYQNAIIVRSPKLVRDSRAT